MTASTTARTVSLAFFTCLVVGLAGCGGSGDSSGTEESQFAGGDATSQRDAASADAKQPATATAVDGAQVYARNCQSCHGPGGEGRAAFPPLRNTEWVTGDRGRLIRLVLHGVKGRMEIDGRTYNAAMSGMDYLSDAQTAAVLTYVRTSFGNEAGEVTPEQVAAVRQNVQRDRSWPASELKAETGIP